MMGQYFQLLRILLDRRVTTVPRQVLAQLSRQGKERLPREVEASLGGRFPGLKGLAFMHRWLDGEQLTRHNGQWVINSFLPPFPGPAFNRMFQNLLSGRRLSPVSGFLAITSQCAYRCWHCSYKHRPGSELETGQWLKVIEALHRLGTSLIGFTGGEPCSRADLPQLVAAASRGGAATILFSSGAGLTPALLTELKQAGLWSVCISLDHPSAAEHDRLRGTPGAHARACQALCWAREHGFYTMVGTVATRRLVEGEPGEPACLPGGSGNARKAGKDAGAPGGAPGLLPAMHHLAGECGAQELRLVEPMPCGLLAGGGDALLEPNHIAALRRFHVETNRQRLQPKVCAFNQIESPELFGCGAGTQHLFIDAAGRVCPCDFTAMSFGNATSEPLEAIWSRMSEAMGNPRRHCFIQTHHRLVLQHAEGQFPLPPDKSCRVCAEAGREPLPDYFQLITGRKE